MWKMMLCAVLALFAAMGAGALGWLLFGRLVAPVGKEMRVLLPARGDGEGLEQAMAGLRWLSAAGLADFRVAVVDHGLSGEGRRLAAHLAERWPELVVCRPGELPGLLEK